MELNPQEIAELAEFFARRFPERESPAALAAELRLSLGNQPTWQDVVDAAHARGRLRDLARAAARRRPEDGNLRELEATFKAPARRVGAMPWIAGAVVLVGVGIWWTQRATAPLEPPAPAAAPAATVVEPVVEPVAAPVEPVAAPVAAPVEPVAAPVEPVAPPTPVQPPAPVVNEPPSAAHIQASRCGGPSGALVGYWYAGSRPPGQAGQTLTLESGANVRSDYPRRDNRWKYNFPVVCSLMAGDRLTLSHAPIRVDGGDYWVPLHAGDLGT